MEFLEGSTVRNLWQGWIQVDDSNDSKAGGETPETMQRVTEVGQKIGEIIGKLHKIGVIHGDLTTSNMMVRSDKRQPPLCSGDTLDIFLIDFGLSKNSESAEEQAVNLFVLERALSSTHPSLSDNFMDHVILPAYSKAAPKADVTLQRLEQVRSRGHKRECFG
jgi:TP53 regulating kinase-like protein